MRNVLGFCALLSALALPCAGTTVTWDFTDDGVQFGTGYVNSWSFTVDGITVTATGWSITGGSANDKFQTAKVDKYAGGLGVCDREELCGHGSPRADNLGRYEFLLFEFDALVHPLSITISPDGDFSGQVSCYAGTIASPHLTGKKPSALDSLGFAGPTDYTAEGSGLITVNLDAGNVNAILFGSFSDVLNGDYLVSSITADVPQPAPVPEPATFGLLGCALAAIGLVHHTRRS